MLSKIRALRTLARRLHDLQMLVSLGVVEQSLLSTLSPIDRHVFLNRPQFASHDYLRWRATRIDATLAIYGTDWTGKQVVELGGGHGDIGVFFADAGAEVLSVEGREENVIIATLKHRNLPRFKCIHRDLEGDFFDLGRFDLVLNFGLLYHIKNIDRHLWNCAQLSDAILLDTEVVDSLDDQKVEFVKENNRDGYEAALSTVGSRPSPFYVKRVFSDLGYDVETILDRKLNTSNHVYDWEHKNDGSWRDGMSRFFHITRTPVGPGSTKIC